MAGCLWLLLLLQLPVFLAAIEQLSLRGSASGGGDSRVGEIENDDTLRRRIVGIGEDTLQKRSIVVGGGSLPSADDEADIEHDIENDNEDHLYREDTIPRKRRRTSNPELAFADNSTAISAIDRYHRDERGDEGEGSHRMFPQTRIIGGKIGSVSWELLLLFLGVCGINAQEPYTHPFAPLILVPTYIHRCSLQQSWEPVLWRYPHSQRCNSNSSTL